MSKPPRRATKGHEWLLVGNTLCPRCRENVEVASPVSIEVIWHTCGLWLEVNCTEWREFKMHPDDIRYNQTMDALEDMGTRPIIIPEDYENE
ncbi:MAG: hypothetical protein FVQ79_04290 [Planctomycetes bacterium]|nr:hypothetical protein [Planctomycetota bacterium]